MRRSVHNCCSTEFRQWSRYCS